MTKETGASHVTCDVFFVTICYANYEIKLTSNMYMYDIVCKLIWVLSLEKYGFCPEFYFASCFLQKIHLAGIINKEQ